MKLMIAYILAGCVIIVASAWIPDDWRPMASLLFLCSLALLMTISRPS